MKSREKSSARCLRRFARLSTRLVTVVGAGTLLIAAKPVYGPGPVYTAGLVRNEEFGFSFTVPKGWRAELGEGRRLYWIGEESGGAPLDLSVETDRIGGYASGGGDSLTSLVRQIFGWNCDADGPEGGQRADSLFAVRRFRTASGYEAIEFSVRVVVEYSGGGDDDADEDSLPPEVPVSLPDSVEEDNYSTSHTAGPFFIVDLGGRGKPSLWIRVSPVCSEPARPAWTRTAREFVRSLRRL